MSNLSSLKSYLKSIIFIAMFPFILSSIAYSNQEKNCKNGISLNSMEIFYNKKSYSSDNLIFSCSNTGKDAKSGLNFIYNSVGNANEDVLYFYFDKIGLVWKTSAIVLGNSKNYYMFGDKNRDEPLSYINIYYIEKKTGVKKLRKYEILSRKNCGEIQLIGSQRTFIDENDILTSSRIDECGEFKVEFKVDLDPVKN